MKNILVFAALMLCQCCVFGQQVNIDPAAVDESVFVEAILPIGGAGSDVVVFGAAGPFFDQPFCARTSPVTGDVIWSRQSSGFGRFLDGAILPNGNFVGVGRFRQSSQDNGLVSVFDPAGVLVWSKVLNVGTRMNIDAVTFDQTGNIYVAGRKGNNLSNAREVLIKFDEIGNTIFSTELEILSQPGPARKIHLRGDSVFVVGEVLNGAISVSLGVYRATDGSLLTYRSFGNNNQTEFLQTAAFSEEGIFFTFLAGTSNVFIVKIRWATLDFEGPVHIYPSGGEALSAGSICVGPNGVYVSGRINGASFVSSFAVKLSHNLSILWGRLLTPTGPGTPDAYGITSTVLSNGDVLFVDQFSNVDATSNVRITGLNSDGLANGTYCQMPTGFNFVPSGYGFTTTPLSRIQANLVFTETSDSYFPYSIGVENCNLSILPVELLFFRAEKSGEVVRLNWATGTERGTSHFDVLRSSDGTDFQKIGEVLSAGDSQTTIDYSFVDDAPLVGTSYYKLESVDLDGSTEFSETQVVHFDRRRQNLVVYPNPARAGEWMTVSGSFQSVSARDQLGRVVPVQRNGNQLAAQAGPGVYLLSFLGADGAIETVKVVIE